MLFCIGDARCGNKTALCQIWSYQSEVCLKMFVSQFPWNSRRLSFSSTVHSEHRFVCLPHMCIFVDNITCFTLNMCHIWYVQFKASEPLYFLHSLQLHMAPCCLSQAGCLERLNNYLANFFWQKASEHIHKQLRQDFWAGTSLVWSAGLIWFLWIKRLQYWVHTRENYWFAILRLICRSQPEEPFKPVGYFHTSAYGSQIFPVLRCIFVSAMLESNFECLEGFVVCAFLLHSEEKLFYEDKHWFQICFGGKTHFQQV